jgi:endonuclease/exonuclease/phosphatase family metal-dependent hydrolase
MALRPPCSRTRLALWLVLALALFSAGCQPPPPTDQPPLYGVLNSLWKGERGGVGTYFYGSRSYLYDQIVVSPGMLDDQGWSCDVDSGAIVTDIADQKGRPLPFGTAKTKGPYSARGASDHFPVTARLHVQGGPGEGYLFCFWNVENFFDDIDDGLKRSSDEPYDSWYGGRNQAFAHKRDKLRDVLLKMNKGKGPDVLGLAEVESEVAVEKLRQALNAQLDQSLHYQPVVFKDAKGGRKISTAVLTRLQPVRNRVHLLSSRRRILLVPIKAHGHELIVVASHWTSRVSDKEGTGRQKYASAIYGHFKAMYLNNPCVDFLVCGDFNDTPEDASVRETLHVSGKRSYVKAACR